MAELEVAERIARQAHAGQVEESTGDDYIKHVERVVGLVRSDEAKSVAWLHDVLEDSDVTEAELLVQGISVRVMDAVHWLSRNKEHTYAKYIDRLRRCGNELAVEVKIADLRDHLRPNCPARLRPRYEKAYGVLLGVYVTG